MNHEALLDFQNAQLNKVWGKYAGKVAGNTDPQQMGRLQVMCPAVLGAAQVWAMPCVPYAGPGVGFYFIPPIGAGVWIEFEGGDVSRAIWSGCYWAKGDLPPAAISADFKLIVTDKATLTIDDVAGEVVLENVSRASITWNADVTTEAGGATHTVGASGVVSESAPGKVEVGAAGVTINSGAFKVS
ncbi:MAG TPA: phage baseplate assembly protein V [Albitalea sp.]